MSLGLCKLTGRPEGNRKTYYLMDIMKFLFCICVIGIHSNLVTDFTYQNANFWIEKAVFRLAVPYFMVSTGFFFGKKVINNKTGDLDSLFVIFAKRLVIMLLIFEPMALFLNIVGWVFHGKGVLYIILKSVQSVLFYPYGALWYVQAVLIGALLVYLLAKQRKSLWGGGVIGGILYLFALLCNTYNYVVQDNIMGNLTRIYLKVFASARNGLFYGFFMIILGVLVQRYHHYILNMLKDNRRKILFFVMGIVLYIAFLAELNHIKGIELADDGALFIAQIPFVIWLLILSVSYETNSTGTVLLRNLSTGMYLLHSITISALRLLAEMISVEVDNIVLFVVTVLFSFTFCVVSYKKLPRIGVFLK